MRGMKEGEEDKGEGERGGEEDRGGGERGVRSQYHNINTRIRKGAEVTLVLNFEGLGLSVPERDFA